MKELKTKKIILSGGGSGGPVTPLLAVAEELLKNEDVSAPKLIFVGTYDGPEREMVAFFNKRLTDEKLPGATSISSQSSDYLEFIPILSGKWRRYFSLFNFLDIFKIIAAYFQTLFLLLSERPDLIISAGGFVSVPLVWAAAGTKTKVLIHQQDVRPGLANKLMSPVARVISVTFEKSLLDYGHRAVWLGNPTIDLSGLEFIDSVAEIKNKYYITASRPLVLFIGGAGGSLFINNLVAEAAPELIKFCRVIHFTGHERLATDVLARTAGSEITDDRSDYVVKEFVSHDELLALIAAADLVVSRAGLSALTELSALNKSAILIPMPGSHQEDNAAVFAKAQAAIVWKQNELSREKLVPELKRILGDADWLTKSSNNISKIIKRGAAKSMAGIVWEILGE
ncbi:hypothetical protein AUJ26_02870 [Candidatus Falkowbacteria bacterium CG1_02_37_21]|nr:MAG: hypothetical protein AUJ26_02870 [Candidatus Falkowbacteria bacterium CG1_02_37_21]